MPEITVEESRRQIQELTDKARKTRQDGHCQQTLDGWRAVLDHPCAHHHVYDYEILDEIHQTLRSAGRFEEAIAAKREAIDAGYRSVPGPEADIAHCLLAAARKQEAETLFEELRERDPGDVWTVRGDGLGLDADDRGVVAAVSPGPRRP